MKVSKRQLKRIIREEYSRLKRQGLLRENNGMPTPDAAYEDGFAAFYEGREEPGHYFKDFEDDWMEGYYDAMNSPAGDYSPSGSTSYNPRPSWNAAKR